MKRKSGLALVIAIVAVVLASCLPFAGCGYCQHKLKELEGVPSTCVKVGLRTAYECEKCGRTFGYSDEKGLYEIKEREPAPFGRHTVGGKNTFVQKEGKTLFGDMDLYSECAECGETFAVDKEGLIPFTPSDNDDKAKAKHVRDGSFSATEFTFSAGTKSGTVHIIKPLNDSGSDSRAYVDVPFTAMTSRYLAVAVFNQSGTDVQIKYGAECYGERCMSDVIKVPAGGYASAAVDIKFSRSDPRSYHELYMMTDLGSAVTLKILGYYYSTEKIKSVALTSIGKTEYSLGEKFDTDDIVLTAAYGDGVTRVLSPDEYSVNLAGKELTSEDTKVVITYKKKTFTYNITVNNFRRSENYARGKTAMASEKGFNSAKFGLGNLTDGLFGNYNAWGSTPHDRADFTVWVQIDLQSVTEINNVTLYPRHDGCYFPAAYRIEVSEDGENFTRVFEEKADGQASSFGTKPRSCSFDGVSARYIRVVATELTNSTGGSYYLELGEIEAYKITEA